MATKRNELLSVIKVIVVALPIINRHVASKALQYVEICLSTSRGVMGYCAMRNEILSVIKSASLRAGGTRAWQSFGKRV